MTLYEKKGRRYIPVSDTEAYRGLPNGSWLVVVREGRTTCREAVDDRAGLEALAGCVQLEDWLVEQIAEESREYPGRDGKPVPLSPKERRAMAAYCEVMGDDVGMWLTRPSIADIARKIVARLAEMVNRDRVNVSS